MQLGFSCPGCGAERSIEAAENTTVLECPDCGYVGLPPLDWVSRGRVRRCPICGSVSLFSRREANQKLIILILLGGAVLAAFTRLLSIPAAVILAFLVWRAAPEALVCYRCRARIRGHRPDPDHRPYDPRTEEEARRTADPERRRPRGERK